MQLKNKCKKERKQFESPYGQRVVMTCQPWREDLSSTMKIDDLTNINCEHS